MSVMVKKKPQGLDTVYRGGASPGRRPGKTLRGAGKTFVAVLAAACLLGAALNGRALAAGGVTVTELAVPGGLSDRTRLLAQADGGLDLFSEVRNKNNMITGILHFHSPDGGQSWQKQDTGWFDACKKQYDYQSPGDSKTYFEPMFFVTDGQNNFYFVSDTETKTYESPKESSKYPVQTLFRLRDGQVTPMKQLDDRDGPFHILRGGGPDGLVLKRTTRDAINAVVFQLLDLDTGAVKYEHIFHGSDPLAYAGGKIYGQNTVTQVSRAEGVDETTGRSPGKMLWLVFDTATGKEIQAVENPLGAEDAQSRPDWGVTQDGTAYFIDSNGLHRLKPGATRAETLLKAGEAKLAPPRYILSHALGYRNDIYVLSCYYNQIDYTDSKNNTELKLLHYTVNN